MLLGKTVFAMIDQILVRIFASELRVILIISLLLLTLAEAGFRLGRRQPREVTEGRKSQITGIQAAVGSQPGSS